MSENTLRHARAVPALLFGPPSNRRFAVRYWDGSLEGPPGPAPFTLVIRSAGSLRRMLAPPNELAIIEAFLSGDVDIDGDIESAVWLGDGIHARLRSRGALASLAPHVLPLPRPDPPSDVRELRADHTVEEVGSPHEPPRARARVPYPHDVANDLLSLWLDPRMVS